MPAYHSCFNNEACKQLGSILMLPIKTKTRGIAPQGDPAQDDIIDEALGFKPLTLGLYRANTFFRNFDVKGGADKLLIYLTLYIQECLAKLSKLPNQLDGARLLQVHAVQNFPLPGDASFPLNSLFEKPATRQDAESLKSYLTQLRQELSSRLVERIYEQDKPSKWWMCFSKKKFMGMSGVGTMG